MSISIGFTGSRFGMSAHQEKRFRNILVLYKIRHKDIVFHHGDCIGADTQAHNIALELGFYIVIHPPLKDKTRSYCNTFNEILPKKSYSQRNCDIVDAADVMIGCPLVYPEPNKRWAGGSWHAIRYSRGKVDKLYVIEREPTCTVYTAQYRYSGSDRLDITVKGKNSIGKYFAPTWNIVYMFRDGSIDWSEYTRIYTDLMRTSYIKHRDIWEEVLSRDEVTFVCFCRKGSDCHRYLLADIFTKIGAVYRGER
jgi:hypothetical protein